MGYLFQRRPSLYLIVFAHQFFSLAFSFTVR